MIRYYLSKQGLKWWFYHPKSKEARMIKDADLITVLASVNLTVSRRTKAGKKYISGLCASTFPPPMHRWKPTVRLVDLLPNTQQLFTNHHSPPTIHNNQYLHSYSTQSQSLFTPYKRTQSRYCWLRLMEVDILIDIPTTFFFVSTPLSTWYLPTFTA